MNPFTRFLRQWSRRPELTQLIDHWDVVEALVVRVYKAGEVTDYDRAAFSATWPWLRAHYDKWARELEPLWRDALVGGEAATTDPFRRLIDVDGPEEFLNDWGAMQHLPAAREALNRLVVQSGE